MCGNSTSATGRLEARSLRAAGRLEASSGRTSPLARFINDRFIRSRYITLLISDYQRFIIGPIPKMPKFAQFIFEYIYINSLLMKMWKNCQIHKFWHSSACKAENSSEFSGLGEQGGAVGNGGQITEIR